MGGEILAGMIIGHSGFDLVQPSPILNFLAEFGFTLALFAMPKYSAW